MRAASRAATAERRAAAPLVLDGVGVSDKQAVSRRKALEHFLDWLVSAAEDGDVCAIDGRDVADGLRVGARDLPPLRPLIQLLLRYAQTRYDAGDAPSTFKAALFAIQDAAAGLGSLRPCWRALRRWTATCESYPHIPMPSRVYNCLLAVALLLNYHDRAAVLVLAWDSGGRDCCARSSPSHRSQ